MDKIEELLSRGVDTLYPSKDAIEKVLRSDKKLTLYQGFDPTGLQMHIGHMVGLRKLSQFQKLGHHVIFLIGDGTGLAGDPSGKTRAREKFLHRDELRANAVDYVKQAGKIVDFEGDNPVEILFNGDWLTELKLEDILRIAENFTWQQLSERDMFEERAKRGEPINMREFLYPLLQGYDSVAMKVDLEIGGSDQTFNMLCGRTLAKNMIQKEKFVLTTPLLTDATGRKIGKTEGNVIALNDIPEELYGKIMALSDDIIVKGLEYLTDVPMEEIQTVQHALENGENPVQYKKRLAHEITKQLHGNDGAQTAQEHFERTVQRKEMPEQIQEIQVANDTVIDDTFLVSNNFAASKSEAKRLFEQGGITVDNEKITNTQHSPSAKNDMIVKIGKRTIVRLKVT